MVVFLKFKKEKMELSNKITRIWSEMLLHGNLLTVVEGGKIDSKILIQLNGSLIYSFVP